MMLAFSFLPQKIQMPGFMIRVTFLGARVTDRSQLQSLKQKNY